MTSRLSSHGRRWLMTLCIHCGIMCGSRAVHPACECVVLRRSWDDRAYGTFTSPNYPRIYSSGISCVLYTFIGNEGEIVEITFEEFDLQLPVSNRCGDYLRFFLDLDRPAVSEHHKWNYELCGNFSMIVRQHYSSTPTLIVEFHTDAYQGNHTGFKGVYRFLNSSIFNEIGGVLRWGTKCSYDFHSNIDSSSPLSSGTFFSPRYPQNYPPNASCHYVFYGQPNERVKVVFHNIQLEYLDGNVEVGINAISIDPHHYGCICLDSPDYILVRDGPDISARIIARYCNTLNNEQVISSAESLYVEFVSDSRKQRQGFAASYSFTIPQTSVTHREGVGDEEDEGITVEEEWNQSEFDDSDGRQKVTEKRVDEGDDRVDERIAVVVERGVNESPSREQPVEGAASLLYPSKFSRNSAVDVSVGSSLSTVFHGPGESRSIFSEGAPRWRPSADTAKKHVCDEAFHSTHRTNGTFQSPNYPKSYHSDVTCHYIFHGHGRERVQIKFTDLLYVPESNSSTAPQACDDLSSVTIRSQINGVAQDLGVFCGNERPPMLMSHQHQIEVIFALRHPANGLISFSADYSFVTATYTYGFSVLLLDSHCLIGVVGSNSNNTFFTSQIQVIDVIMGQSRIAAVLLLLLTNFGIRAGEQDLEMACGFIFRSNVSTSGTFTSPNFPGFYPRNSECHYIFYGAGTERIHINFPYFDVEGVEPGCLESTQSDYLEFSNFNIELIDRKMSRFCGTKRDDEEEKSAQFQIPIAKRRSVISDGNFFRVTFKSNSVYDATGFDAYYQFRKAEVSDFRNSRTMSSPSYSAAISVTHFYYHPARMVRLVQAVVTFFALGLFILIIL